MSTHHVPVNKQSRGTQRFQSKADVFISQMTSLQNSEYELIQFMVANKVWQGPVPLPPHRYKKGSTIDYGIYLYWANNPSAVKAIANEDLDWVILAFLIIVNLCGVALPKSLLTDDNYQTLCGTKLIYIDGSVMSTGSFGMYDPNWLRTLINLAITTLFGTKYNDGVLPSPPVPSVPIALAGAKPGEISLGLLSDWGAGTPVAAEVMHGLTALQPDYLIHLGDIYYSGSPSTDQQLSFSYDHPGDVKNHFLALWPTDTYAGKSFTLNGNHEMYCGANGLFSDALADPAFSGQFGVTYFAMQAGDWTILCLDSAYYADEEDLYMYGRIDGKDASANIQSAWIKGLNLDPKKVIVMTHHNAFDPNLAPEPQQENYQPFWNSVHQALGGDPYAWYWGHAHNAIVYRSPVTIAGADHQGPPCFTTDTYCRCIGHGAMPYGATDALGHITDSDNPYAWCAQYASNLPPGELPNGSATLTFALDAQNMVSQITENYYLTNNLAKPAFTNTLFAKAM